MNSTVIDGQDANAWKAFWWSCLALLIAGLLPFLAHPYPAMGDYPNHLARLHILTNQLPDGWQRFYYLNHLLQPNLALDALCGIMVQAGLPVDDTLRLFAALGFLLPAVGAILVASEGAIAPPWFALWVIPLALSRYLMWGFLNYFFSLGVALLTFWLWSRASNLKAAPVTVALRVLVSGLFVALTFLHLMGFGFAVLIIGMFEIARHIEDRLHRKTISDFVTLFVVALPSLVVYVFAFAHHAANPTYSDYLSGKIAGLASPFLLYTPLLAGFIALLWLTSLALTIYIDGPAAIRPSAIRWIPTAGVIVFFLIAPCEMMGSAFLDRRVFALGMLLTCTMVSVRSQHTRRIVLALATLTMLLKIGELDRAWSENDKIYDELRTALTEVPRNSRLIGFNFTDSGSLMAPTLLHAPMYAVIDRAAYVPTLFAEPIARELISYRPGFEPVSVQGSGGNFLPSTRPDWMSACRRYDYLLLTFVRQPPTEVAPTCLTILRRGSQFILYRSTAPSPDKTAKTKDNVDTDLH